MRVRMSFFDRLRNNSRFRKAFTNDFPEVSDHMPYQESGTEVLDLPYPNSDFDAFSSDISEIKNKKLPKRLDWEQMEPQGGKNMVKGLAKRVIVVKSPDPKIFEEAIFIIREDYLNNKGVSSDELIKEAQRVAHVYAKSQLSEKRSLLSRLPAPVFAAAGAAATGIAWLAMRLVGIPV